MKKFSFITKLTAAVAILAILAVNQLSAVTIVFTVGAGGAHNASNIITGPLTLNSIKVDTGSSGGATNLVYSLRDFPGLDVTKGWGRIMQTNTGYMQISQYLTNITKIVTNFNSGDGAGNYVTFTNTFTNAVYTYTNYVGQSSNAWRIIAAGNVGSNSAVTLTGPFPAIYGLGFTNNSIGKDITLTIDYNPSL